MIFPKRVVKIIAIINLKSFVPLYEFLKVIIDVGKSVRVLIFKIRKVIILFVGLSFASSFISLNAFNPVDVDATPKPKIFEKRVSEIYSIVLELGSISGKMNFKNLDKYLVNFFKRPVSYNILKIPFQKIIMKDNFKKISNASDVEFNIILSKVKILPVNIEINIPKKTKVIQM